MHYIYGLADEQDHIIRYVGQTNKFEKRVRDHRSEARSFKTKYNRKDNWIRSVEKAGRNVEGILLEVVPDQESANEAERFHIAQMLEMGFNLTNSTSGGDGAYKRSAEVVERHRIFMTGRTASEETKRKMSEAAKARVKNTPGERERLSRIATVLPPTFRGETASNSKLTDEIVKDIRVKMNGGVKLSTICKEHPEISQTTIWQAATGKSWAHVDEKVYAPKRKQKLYKQDILDIQKAILAGDSNKDLALKYNINPSVISNIRTGKRKA